MIVIGEGAVVKQGLPAFLACPMAPDIVRTEAAYEFRGLVKRVDLK